MHSDLDSVRSLACIDARSLVKDEPSLWQKSLLNGLSCILDDCDSRLVTCIDRIQSLLLLCRVAAIVVALLPVDVGLGLVCKSAPAPEIEAREEAILLSGLGDAAEYMAVISIT